MILNFRLFPNSILYCEGREKPYFRGKVHAFGAFILCPAWFIVSYNHLDTLYENIALAMFFIGTMLCWGCSALYHILQWTIHQEILIQRLDHAAIFVCISSSFIPILLLLNSKIHGLATFTILFLIISCSLYGIWRVFTKREGIMSVCVTNIALMVPSFPFLAKFLTNTEKLYGLVSIIMYSIGAIVFHHKIINIIPTIFGYHEIFHACTVIATFLVFLTYLSIIRDYDLRCHVTLEQSRIQNIASVIFGLSDVCYSP